MVACRMGSKWVEDDPSNHNGSNVTQQTTELHVYQHFCKLGPKLSPKLLQPLPPLPPLETFHSHFVW